MPVTQKRHVLIQMDLTPVSVILDTVAAGNHAQVTEHIITKTCM